MNNIWINITIAIIQIILMLAIAFWQISVAKSIARNELGKKISIKSRLRIFLSKHTKTIIKLAVLGNIFIIILFCIKKVPPTRIEIVYIIFLSISSFALLMLDLYKDLLGHISKSHEILYCMICRRSEDKKPICIEEIKKTVDEN